MSFKLLTYSLLSLPLSRHVVSCAAFMVGVAFSVRVFQAAPDAFHVYSVEFTHPATILIPLFQYSLAGAASDSARLCFQLFDCGSDFGTSPFVAAVFLCTEPRTIFGATERIGKDV